MFKFNPQHSLYNSTYGILKYVVSFRLYKLFTKTIVFLNCEALCCLYWFECSIASHFSTSLMFARPPRDLRARNPMWDAKTYFKAHKVNVCEPTLRLCVLR